MEGILWIISSGLLPTSLSRLVRTSWSTSSHLSRSAHELKHQFTLVTQCARAESPGHTSHDFTRVSTTCSSSNGPFVGSDGRKRAEYVLCGPTLRALPSWASGWDYYWHLPRTENQRLGIRGPRGTTTSGNVSNHWRQDDRGKDHQKSQEGGRPSPRWVSGKKQRAFVVYTCSCGMTQYALSTIMYVQHAAIGVLL